MTQLTKTVALTSIYFVYLSTFLTVSVQKWKSGVPEWFKQQFQNTLLTSLPGGITLGFYTITLLETLVASLFLISLFRLEILGGSREFMELGLALSMLTFGALGFGLRISNDFQGAANLFMYFGVSGLILLFVRFLA